MNYEEKLSCVLVIGSGGQTKFGFLEELIKFGRHVILIDGIEKSNVKYPDNLETVFLPKLDIDSVLKTVKKLSKNYKITNVGTVYEPCMETAANVREYLGIEGFKYDETILTRNKGAMAGFLSSISIQVPKYVIFDQNSTRENIIALSKQFSLPFILKPTTGSSNKGLRFIRSYEKFWEYYQQALKDVKDYSGKNYEYSDSSDEWMLCEYIKGREVEVDIYVEEGSIVFKAIREKPLIFEREETIEENSSIIPPLTLTEKEVSNFETIIERLSKAVYEKMARHCSVKYFTIFAEFRIDSNGNFYCLEFTLRPAGALCPVIIQKSTGVSIFEIAAYCMLGEKAPIKQKPSKRSVYFQILYSNRCGIYKGISGLDDTVDVSFIPNKKTGDIIKVPQAEYLAFILVEADKQEEVLAKTTKYLKNGEILIETSEGKLEKIKIPLPSSQT